MKGRSCLRLCSRTISSRTIGSFLLVLWLLLGKFSNAQSTIGDITGTVTDSTGAVVSGATVILRNIGTHEMRSVTTSSSGGYTFTLLNPGSYSIQIEASGFFTANIPEVALAAGDRAREDARLQVGSSAQTVQVTAQAPALQTDSFHGSICEFFHKDVLDAYPSQFSAHIPKPELQHNQFGGSIGGPIIHDKVFFFGDYEGLRRFLVSNPVISQVPTQDQNNLLRSNPTALAHGTVDPVGLQYAMLYPAPNAASTTNGASGSFLSSPTVTRTSDTVDGRMDVQLNHNNLFYERTDNPLRGYDKRRVCALR